MFPLDFPLDILKEHARNNDYVLDPFCGRGTTNFAARLVGLSSLGVDSSPVAVAITSSKLVVTSVEAIIEEARHILAEYKPCDVPSGEFWQLAYHPDVLHSLCCFREVFLEDCSMPSRIALRGIILGAMHGPKQKTFQSYLSNQCPRTYAPKPAYATRFWRERGLEPEIVDILDVIERRAKRYYETLPNTIGTIRLADSRQPEALQPISPDIGYNWVITSPPYYGMRTYIPDQWLRNWFLGGPDIVDYNNNNQIVHKSPVDFVADLRQVWRNTAAVCDDNAKLIVRFGGIAYRRVNPLELLSNSFVDSGWCVSEIFNAGSASEGKRQASCFLRNESKPINEYDVWAVKDINVRH
jgi:hypothetical protein